MIIKSSNYVLTSVHTLMSHVLVCNI